MIGYKLFTFLGMSNIRQWGVICVDEPNRTFLFPTQYSAYNTLRELNRLYSALEDETIAHRNTQDKLDKPMCLSCGDWLGSPTQLNARFCSQECAIKEAGTVMTPNLRFQRIYQPA